MIWPSSSMDASSVPHEVSVRYHEKHYEFWGSWKAPIHMQPHQLCWWPCRDCNTCEQSFMLVLPSARHNGSYYYGGVNAHNPFSKDRYLLHSYFMCLTWASCIFFLANCRRAYIFSKSLPVCWFFTVMFANKDGIPTLFPYVASKGLRPIKRCLVLLQ